MTPVLVNCKLAIYAIYKLLNCGVWIIYLELFQLFMEDLEKLRKQFVFWEMVNNKVILTNENQAIHEDTEMHLAGLVVHGCKLAQVRNSWAVS